MFTTKKELSNIKSRLKKLECSHDGGVRFVHGLMDNYYKECKLCNTVLERYYRYTDFLKAHIAFHENYNAKLRKQLSAIETG